LLYGTEIIPIPGFADPVSSWSHLLGAGVFTILGLWLLHGGRGSLARQGWLAVYAVSCVFLFSMSGVYHLLPPGGTARAVLERMDHAGIFVLIAGTFTPIHGLLFRGLGRWGMLLLIWSAAITGIVLKTVFFHDVPEWLGLAIYLSLGWLGVVSCFSLWRRYGFRFVRPLLTGGVIYTAGAAMHFAAWPVLVPGVVGPHEVCHIAVLIAAGLHWIFIRQLTSRAVTARRTRTLVPSTVSPLLTRVLATAAMEKSRVHETIE